MKLNFIVAASKTYIHCQWLGGTIQRPYSNDPYGLHKVCVVVGHAPKLPYRPNPPLCDDDGCYHGT